MGNQKKQKKAALGFSVISLSLIDRNSFNPRKVFNEEALEELALSIKGKGVIQPIVVRPVGNRYEIVCGERRFRASLIAGMENIPACIKELSDDEAEEYAITENLQRKDVSPLEEAEAFSKLVSGGKYDINSLVIKFGKSEAFIRGRLKLVNLIMEFRNMLEKDAINIGVAGVLACYPNDLQNKIYIEHFDENCLGWQSWINYKASRVQYAIEDTYSTKLEKYAFDKEECKNCPYNNATFSLFVEGVGTCAKRECLTEKNAMYIYQQVIDMQNANPSFGICKHPCLSTNANVIEKLQENGYEVQTIYATNDYEEPELPSRDEYENEDDFNDAMNEYEEEKQEYENAIEDRNALVAAGDIKPYIQVGMNEVKIVYAEAPKSEEEEINTDGNSMKGKVVQKNPEIIKLQKKISRNEEICYEKIVERQKKLVKDMDVPSGELHEEEVALMYFYMIRKMRDSVYQKLAVGKEKYSLKYADLLELTTEQISIITRDFIISHLEQSYCGSEEKENNPLRVFLNFHQAEQVENIDKDLTEIYKKRNDRLQERIEAMEEAPVGEDKTNSESQEN